MMFGAGLGVGLMVFATAEPLGLWGSNPVILGSDIAPNTASSLQSGYRYTFLHYGFHAWAIYVVTGLSLAYYAYTRNMPLTIRSALTPILGRYANGMLGHVIDVLGVVATILGVSVTVGFGVSQFIDGMYAITGMEWLMNGDVAAPKASTVGLLTGLVMIMAMSTLSAVSGVGRGVKYLSNLNLVLSIILLLVFVVFGSFLFAMTTYAQALADYLLHFFSLSFGAYHPMTEAAYAATLPEAASALSVEDKAAVFAGATNAWGSACCASARACLPLWPRLARRSDGGDLCLGHRRASVRLASGLDHVLLGLVDRVFALCGLVPRPYLQRAFCARVHPGRCYRPGAGLLCLDDHSGRHGDRP